ncbi:MAG: arsenite methyltransferase [Candidatus Omnitrophica bacterium]|nr:arsenite methyltransferase [Candidatus Omnitrophota bacterium]
MEGKSKNIRKMVRDGYAKVAQQGISCCSSGGCCLPSSTAHNISKTVGYSEEDISTVPDGAILGLGCGNPVAIASLQEGDVVLDLGSGAGFDVFLAAKKVGKTGHVIGVDMTQEMIDRAKNNARKGGYSNVEFRHGEIESIPVVDNSVDVIISNCVINLSPEKNKVFREAFRVLKPKGRLMVSDLVLIKNLPEAVKNSVEAYVGCLAGAEMKDAYLHCIEEAGFKDIRVVSQSGYPVDAMVIDTKIKEVENSIASIKVHAVKP